MDGGPTVEGSLDALVSGKRSSPRHAVELQAVVKAVRGSFHARVLDLSLDGARLSIALDAPDSVVLELPILSPVSDSTVVVNSRTGLIIVGQNVEFRPVLVRNACRGNRRQRHRQIAQHQIAELRHHGSPSRPAAASGPGSHAAASIRWPATRSSATSIPRSPICV